MGNQQRHKEREDTEAVRAGIRASAAFADAEFSSTFFLPAYWWEEIRCWSGHRGLCFRRRLTVILEGIALAGSIVRASTDHRPSSTNSIGSGVPRSTSTRNRLASLPFFSLYSSSLVLEGVAKVALDCAHRTSTVSSCAFCEQGGRLATPLPPMHLNKYGGTLLVLLRPGRSAAGPCRDGEVEEVAIQAGQVATVGGAPEHRITK